MEGLQNSQQHGPIKDTNLKALEQQKLSSQKLAERVIQSDDSVKVLVAPFMKKRDSNDEGELVSLGASSFSIQGRLRAHELFNVANNK